MTTTPDFVAIMRDAEAWPARGWGIRPGVACALKNTVDGRLGLIVNVAHRDRLTVYEVNVFERDKMWAIFNTTGPTGVPEHTYIDFEGMADAGWRPD